MVTHESILVGCLGNSCVIGPGWRVGLRHAKHGA
jgi:hypothetical protein